MEPKTRFTSVDDYILTFPVSAQKKLREIRKAIKESAPEAMEKISYNMPAYTYKGMLVYFAAHTSHLGFYPMKSSIKAFEKELTDYNCSAGTVQFPYSRPLPVDLIKRIVKFRIEENNQKSKAKS
jgi:uncharacterized protein YdhG (YjbR/CyaY superfamily)